MCLAFTPEVQDSVASCLDAWGAGHGEETCFGSRVSAYSVH